MTIDISIRVGDVRLRYRGPAEVIGAGGVEGLLLAVTRAACRTCDDDREEPTEPGPTGPTTGGVTGRAVDSWAGTPVTGATFTADGATFGTSDADGSFTVPAIPSHMPYWLRSDPPSQYRPSVHGPISTGPGGDVGVVALFSRADIVRQYAGVGRTPMAGTAVVIVDLRDSLGGPLAGVLAADLNLVDSAGQPAAGAGPLFLGPSGDFETLASSVVVNGSNASAAFLDVPATGQPLTLGLAMADETGLVSTVTSVVEVIGDGVTSTTLRPAS